MEEESRKHRAMDTLLAILKLGIVGKAQRRCVLRCVLKLYTCANGIGADLDVLLWKSAPAACLAVELTGLGVPIVQTPRRLDLQVPVYSVGRPAQAYGASRAQTMGTTM